MYNDDKYRGINLKDIIIKVVFAIIFILLIIWLFPKVPNMKPFYSNVFRENISYMQDAAESYYTNERLPKNVGDSVEMTLGEMIDKNIILPFVDKDGKSCDTKASYVQVTKNKTDYTLLVNLVCPTEKNTLKKTLGCHEYCEDCDKTKEIEYQFQKAVTANQTVYTCPKGGTLSGTKCNVYTTSSYKATATTAADKYTCPKGGTLSGTNCVVESTTTYTATKVSKGTKYECDKGGTLSGTKCTINEKTTKTYNATSSYVASSSYNASLTYGSSTSYNATFSNVKSGYTYAATKSTTPDVKYAATETSGIHSLYGYYETKPQGYSCKLGLADSSCTTCSKTKLYYYNCTATKSTYSCPNGGNLDSTGRTCVIKGKDSYSCPNGGKLVGQSCVISNTYSYTCPNGGTLSGTKCVVSGKTLYSCPNGGTLSGTICYVDTTNINTYNAKAVSLGYDYKCSNNDKLSGTVCVNTKKSTYAATKTAGKTTYTCPNGGTLKDKECTISKLTNTYNATASTKQVTKYEYKWSKEEAIAGWTKTGKTREV